MTELITSVEPRDCPYFGLDYYREEYGAWFFGREPDGDKIITNLMAARLTLLHAESGVGKSSLLRAGVAWRLRQLARAESPSAGSIVDLPVVFSSWKDDPVRELVEEIRRSIEPFLAGRPVPSLPSGQLDAAIEAAAEAADASLLVILDQFEEYFVYCSREPVPERFADELARCINRADMPANFLISIREDAYAGLGDLFKGRIANVYGNYLHIEYLDRESAEQAIRAPLEVYNRQPGIAEPVTIQDDLVEAVLDQVPAYGAGGDPAAGRAAANGSGGRVSTPLLQLVMETVWQRELSQGSHELRLQTLQNLEGVGKIVDIHLGQALRALDAGERETAIDTFDHLVTPSGGKIAESVPYLAHRTGHTEDQVGSVLEKLDHARIVRPVPAPPGQDSVRFRRYEIFHDVLAPAINDVIAARDGQRRARRLRRLAALSAGSLVVALAIAGVFLYLWHNAVTQRQIAESRQLAAVAAADLARDPQMSTLLALHALHVYDTSQAEEAIGAALPDVQTVRTFQNGTPAFGAVFDPADPNKVASAGQDGSAWIWDVKTGRRLVSLSPHAGLGAANSVAFNAGGSQVAVGYEDGTVDLFNAPSGSLLRKISVGPVINGVTFIGRTKALAIATQQGAGLWLPGTRCCYPFYRKQANAIAVDPQNNLEFAVATDSGTRIWRLDNSLHPVWSRTLSQGQTTSSQGLAATLADQDAEFSPDGRQVVTADADGAVRVYNVATARLVATLNAGLGQGEAQSVAFSPNGKLIVAGYSGGPALVWDAATHLQQTQLTGDVGAVVSAEFSANNREVLTSSEDGSVRVWQAQPRELQTAFPVILPDPVYAAEYSPNGHQVLAVDRAGFADVMTSTGGTVGFVFPPSAAAVNTAQYNQTGTRIVTADEDGTVDLWRVTRSNPVLSRLPSPIRLTGGGPAQYAVFSPNGSRIVVVTDNLTAEVFSAQTGHLLHTLNPHSFFQLSVARFSRDGSQILTGDYDGQVQVWNAVTGHEIRVLGRQGPGIDDIEFDRSGGTFATVSADGVVTTWAARGDRRLRSFAACPAPNTVALSPGGRFVVVACTDGTAPVFSAATGQQVTVISDPGNVTSAAFSPDGKSIITTFSAGSTGGVRIWSSQLAVSSLAALKHLATSWITPDFTPGRLYAAGVVPSRSSAP